MYDLIDANRGVVAVAIILSAMALATLLYHTYSTNPRAIMVFVLFVAVSFIFELLYGRMVRGQFFERQY
jgi:nitrogen fixation/metabolism regulation signal transduction histidine kinase